MGNIGVQLSGKGGVEDALICLVISEESFEGLEDEVRCD